MRPVPVRTPAPLRGPLRGGDPATAGRVPSPSSSGCPRLRSMRCRTASTRPPVRSSSPVPTPGGRSRPWRCAPGDRVLIVGAGAIGLLAALIARARGLEVDILGRSEGSAALRRVPRVRADLVGRGTADRSLRRRDRRLARSGLAGAHRRAGRARRSRRVDRPRRAARASSTAGGSSSRTSPSSACSVAHRASPG